MKVQTCVCLPRIESRLDYISFSPSYVFPRAAKMMHDAMPSRCPLLQYVVMLPFMSLLLLM
jgi:hypothetical protein